ncbi:MAG: hypothetical protein WB757_00130, partial [Candidatus Cybelea sp.]
LCLIAFAQKGRALAYKRLATAASRTKQANGFDGTGHDCGDRYRVERNSKCLISVYAVRLLAFARASLF